MHNDNIKHYLFIITKKGIFPLFFYFLLFCIFTYPLILQFSTHFFSSGGAGDDTFQGIWNIWWVNKSVTQLGQSPFQTFYLHFPHGTSLLTHDLIPLLSFSGILFLKILTMVEYYNLFIIFSFILTGLTTFLLAHYFTKSYLGSIIAGFIFTFCTYRFAHMSVGHSGVISLEWIPLFVLCWYILLTRPSIRIGIASAFFLFLVLLCNYYYFFYCVLIGFLMIVWITIQKRELFYFFKKRYILPFISFATGISLTAGYWIISMFLLIQRDPPVYGIHPPDGFPTDLFAFIIPGAYWRFNYLTESYWSNLRGNINESSVFLGLSVLIVLIYVWIKRKKLFNNKIWYLWYFIIIFFAVMSLGPKLNIFGNEITAIRGLPYTWLEKIFPFIKAGGVPVRMMIITTLGASVICALGFKHLFRSSLKTRLLGVALLLLLLFEYFPKPMPSIKIDIPKYVYFLKSLPGTEGILDTTIIRRHGKTHSETISMYYQTIHEKPKAFGYISKITKSVYDKNKQIRKLIDKKEYSLLYQDYNFKYLIIDAETNISSNKITIKIIYQDDQYKIYHLGI